MQYGFLRRVFPKLSKLTTFGPTPKRRLVPTSKQQQSCFWRMAPKSRNCSRFRASRHLRRTGQWSVSSTPAACTGRVEFSCKRGRGAWWMAQGSTGCPEEDTGHAQESLADADDAWSILCMKGCLPTLFLRCMMTHPTLVPIPEDVAKSGPDTTSHGKGQYTA